MFDLEFNRQNPGLPAATACPQALRGAGFGSWLALAAVSCALLAAGCDSGGSTEVEGSRAGVFIDSPVQGLIYQTPTHEGSTDSDGTFYYLPREVVRFYIGDIEIGSAEGQDILTPLEFVPDAVDASHPEVTNVLRFLQSLDEDGDPDNGITISALTITQAESQSLDFTLSENDFETAANALLSVLTGGEVIELVDAADALEHFESSVGGGSAGAGGSGGSGGGSSASDLTLSGVDTALFGASFTADPAMTVVDANNPGSIIWRQTLPDTSLLEVSVILLNGNINNVIFTWTNNSGSGPASANYGVTCAGIAVLYPLGDCSQMSIDTVAGEVVYDVTLTPGGLDGATAPLSVDGLLEF